MFSFVSTAPTPRPRTRYGFAWFHFAALLVLFTVLRLVLLFTFLRLESLSPGEILKGLLIGLHCDICIALVLTLPLLGWFWLCPEKWFSRRWHRTFFLAAWSFFWVAQVFGAFAEFYFFEEFRSRFNTVAVDYLLYPHEVFINIWDSYPVVWVLLICVGAAGALFSGAWKYFRNMWLEPVSPRSRRLYLGGGVLAAAALLSTVSFTENRFSDQRALNEVAGNGAVSFVAAAWTRQLDFTAFYRTISRTEAREEARRLLQEPGTEFIAGADSIVRRVAGDAGRPRLNVVIFLEESLGSEFWGSLGRKKPTCTPEMDRLAREEGMLFTNIYASGNRTVRGFEGVLSSFPPLPGDSIVKRPFSGHVETIARTLKRDGYATLFLYGGRGVFDGMRSFALRNGYDRFIEEKDFEHPTFSTIWGVCDEDLYQRSLEEFRALSQSGEPFFATILSVSNHKPYTYPKGRISEDPDRRQRSFAVKYADYALGRFFEAAKREAFYTNTIFVVVADHGARVYGSQEIPIHSYEIPLLITGPAAVKAPVRVARLGCSLDVAPTVLGLMGRPYTSVFFGRDLLKASPESGRVLLNHNRDIGMYADERMVVFGINKSIEFYAGDPKVTEMKRLSRPGEQEFELARQAISLFQVADELYMNRHYRVDLPVQTRRLPVPGSGRHASSTSQKPQQVPVFQEPVQRFRNGAVN